MLLPLCIYAKTSDLEALGSCFSNLQKDTIWQYIIQKYFKQTSFYVCYFSLGMKTNGA